MTRYNSAAAIIKKEELQQRQWSGRQKQLLRCLNYVYLIETSPLNHMHVKIINMCMCSVNVGPIIYPSSTH